MDLPALSHIDELKGAFVDSSLLRPFSESEALDVARRIVPAIKALFSQPEKTATVLQDLFHPEAFWRDAVALTWSLRTFHPTRTILDNIVPLVKRAGIPAESVVLQEEQVLAISLPNGVSVVRAPFTFKTTTPAASATAAFKLIRLANGDIKVFTVTTALAELEAAPWQAVGKATVSEKLPEAVDVLVIGGGHGGLAIAVYLKALGVSLAVVDKEAAVGDGWAKRYDSATLHTTRLFSGLPYIPFPSDYPQYVPAKLVAQYYKNYVKELGLPVYCGRTCLSAEYDKEWTLKLSTGEVMRAKALVFAVSVGGRVPVTPDFPGQDTFKGEALHSAAYTDASRWKGKRVAVIGSSTTACDVSHDCCRAGADVTMIQRGPTRIYPSSHIEAIQTMFWNTNQPVEVGDVISSEDPIVLQAALSSLVFAQMRDAHDPEYYAGLERAGFKAVVDGSIHQQIYCRAGAHYPDIGACAAIANGEIKVDGRPILGVTETGLRFADGRLDVDVIVYATGFEKDARKQVRDIVGSLPLESVWGLDAEGEVRGTWRPTGHPALWFQGGELQTMRYYGKFLAMQVVAGIKGLVPL